mgnify:CR=1 FL=1
MKFWNIWAKAIGQKAFENDDRASDIAAVIRTVILFAYLFTNAVIVAGVLKHWND